MSNRIDEQIDGIHDIIKTIETHQRRKRMEFEHGKIVVHRTHNTTPAHEWDFEAYFDRYLDDEMPSWTRGFGASQDAALADLLENAEEHLREINDVKFQDEMQRRAGC